jgi:hypothetical protein
MTYLSSLSTELIGISNLSTAPVEITTTAGSTVDAPSAASAR